MRKTLIVILFIVSMFSYGQVTTNLELVVDEVLTSKNKNIGYLSLEVELQKDIQSLNEDILLNMKIYALSRYFDFENGYSAKASMLGYEISNKRISNTEVYRLEQVKLVEATISKLINLGDRTKIIINAQIGVGYSSASMVDQDYLILSDSELEKLKKSRSCKNCIAEGVEKSGSLPLKTGVSIRLDHKNSYIALNVNREKSGMYRRLLDETGEEYQYGYRMIFDWERRTIYNTSIEVGHQFKIKNISLDTFLRAEYIYSQHSSEIAEQGADVRFYDSKEIIKRDAMKNSFVGVGLRINLFKKKKEKLF